MLIYILLGIIAIGVLLISKEGKLILKYLSRILIFCIGIALTSIALYVLFIAFMKIPEDQRPVIAKFFFLPVLAIPGWIIAKMHQKKIQEKLTQALEQFEKTGDDSELKEIAQQEKRNEEFLKLKEQKRKKREAFSAKSVKYIVISISLFIFALLLVLLFAIF